MPTDGATASARQVELLEAAYRYALEHGIADMSLRPLAAAIGSSPRVLVFLFGNKDGLVRALLARARTDELALLERLDRDSAGQPIGLVRATDEIWTWLVDDHHRGLLRLWAEAYTRSLMESDGAWSGFARATVDDWLTVLANCQPPEERNSESGIASRTLALAVLRGALLDVLATGDRQRVNSAVASALALLGAPSTGTAQR